MPVLCLNKKALFDYEILETIEAGLVLEGHEVKSLRQGSASMKGAFAVMKDDEPWLVNLHITPYRHAGKLADYSPTRSRKLLLRKKEIARLKGKLAEEGLTLVPLKIYTAKTRIKVSLGIARGKKRYEKRELIKKRDIERQIRERFKTRT